MKPLRVIIVGVLLAVCAIGVIYTSSCSKNACGGVNCQNGGTCSGGVCQCPTGTGGNNCEVIYRNAYVNTYIGNNKLDTLLTYNDSVRNAVDCLNSTLTFDTSGTTSLLQMNLTYTDTIAGGFTLRFSATLANTTTTGSTFTVQSQKINGFTYTGSGTVSAGTASFNFTAISDTSVHNPADTGTTISFLCNNFIAQ